LTVLREMAGMAFREVLVTEVKEVLRAWLAGLGKRPAAARAGVNVKTAARYIRAAQEAGLSRDSGEGRLTDELIGIVVGAVRPVRPAGHGSSWGGPGRPEGRDRRLGEGGPDAGEDRGAAGAVGDRGSLPDAGAVRRAGVRVLVWPAGGEGAGRRPAAGP
jgi:hypothetical protein